MEHDDVAVLLKVKLWQGFELIYSLSGAGIFSYSICGSFLFGVCLEIRAWDKVYKDLKVASSDVYDLGNSKASATAKRITVANSSACMKETTRKNPFTVDFVIQVISMSMTSEQFVRNN